MALEKMNKPSSFSKLIEKESLCTGELGLVMPVPPLRFERRHTNDNWHTDTNTLGKARIAVTKAMPILIDHE